MRGGTAGRAARSAAGWFVVTAASVLSGCDAAQTGSAYFTVRDSADVLIAENTRGGGWSPEEAPELVEELRIGVVEGADEHQFSYVAGVDTDDEGRIYVLDAQALEVRVFSTEGEFLRTIGGPGEGPGELQSGLAMFVVGEALLVPDILAGRIHRFTLDGAESGSFARDSRAIGQGWAPTPSGEILTLVPLSQLDIADPSPGNALVRSDGSGTIIDTVLTLPPTSNARLRDGRMVVRLLSPAPRWAVDAGGNLLSTESVHLRIEVRSTAGVLERVIALDADSVAVTEEYREAVLSRMPSARGGFEIEFAEYHPGVMGLFAGPSGTIWVLSPVGYADDETLDTVWRVFTSEGQYLGALDLDFSPMVTRGDRIYGVATDELDVPYVVRVRMEGLEPMGVP